ncbi:hypothetical protein Hanom_Chr06g00563711 [Helianthus anomalus]
MIFKINLTSSSNLHKSAEYPKSFIVVSPRKCRPSYIVSIKAPYLIKDKL